MHIPQPSEGAGMWDVRCDKLPEGESVHPKVTVRSLLAGVRVMFWGANDEVQTQG